MALLFSFGLTRPRKVSHESLQIKPLRISLGPTLLPTRGHRLQPASSSGLLAVLGADFAPCFRNAASSEASEQAESTQRISAASSAIHEAGMRLSRVVSRLIELKTELPTSDGVNVCACDDDRLF